MSQTCSLPQQKTLLTYREAVGQNKIASKTKQINLQQSTKNLKIQITSSEETKVLTLQLVKEKF